MEIINTVVSIGYIVDTLKKQGKKVGFIPTMGALHQGHLSLVAQSKAGNDVTVVSIFVNPTQFNDKEDLKNYPRTLEADAKKLEAAGVDFIFAPSESEMYPEPDIRIFDFGNLDKVMEGAHRPGHFNGVAQIVSKLFAAVNPMNAYFGEKDFQQLAIIKQMVKQLNLSVHIIPCPIIREPDGLAMSSRNMLLNKSQRENSVLISKTLMESRKKAREFSMEELKVWVVNTINANVELDVEYFEIVDDTYLLPAKSWNEPTQKIGCIAVKVGTIRLIDNIKYNS
jgi:pantoate--beta-alanine ligase